MTMPESDLILVHDLSWAGGFLATLENMRSRSLMCDVVIKGSGGREHRAHSVILSAVSTVLGGLLGMKSTEDVVIETDIADDIWDLLLDFVYKGTVDVPLAKKKEFFEVGRQFGMQLPESLDTMNGIYVPGGESGETVTLEGCGDVIEIKQEIEEEENETTAESEIPLSSSVLELSSSSPSSQLQVSDETNLLTSHPIATVDSVSECSNALNSDVGMDTPQTSVPGGTFYKCHLCPKFFRQPWYLRKHEAIHAAAESGIEGDIEHKFRCSLCPRSFSRRYRLAQHEQAHARDSAMSHNSVLSHKRSAALAEAKRSEKFRCSMCPRVLSGQAFLASHEQAHLRREEKRSSTAVPDFQANKRHACSKCPKTFRSPYSLRMHLECHSRNTNKRASTMKGDWKLREKSDVTCEKCGRTYRYGTYVRFHAPICLGLCARTGAPLEDTPFLCNRCPRSFRRRRDLMHHEMEHSGEEPRQCHLCGKMVRNVARHRKAHHPTGGLLSCRLCQKTFSQRGNLERHLRAHAGEKPFVCRLCTGNTVAFADRASLRGHLMRAHAGVRPFQCCLCDAAYCSRFKAAEHVRMKHSVLKEECRLHVIENIDGAARLTGEWSKLEARSNVAGQREGDGDIVEEETLTEEYMNGGCSFEVDENLKCDDISEVEIGSFDSSALVL